MLSFYPSQVACCWTTHIFYVLNFGSYELEYLWDPNGGAEAFSLIPHSLCRNTMNQTSTTEIPRFPYSKLSSHNSWQLVTCPIFPVRTEIQYFSLNMLSPNLNIPKTAVSFKEKCLETFGWGKSSRQWVSKEACLTTSMSVVVIKHSDQKQFREEKVYLSYVSSSQCIVEGGQGRNSSPMHGGTPIASSLEGLCLASFLLHPGP